MAFDYTATAADALALLTEFGQSVTRRSYAAGTYDPTAGSVTPTTADTSRIGVKIPINRGQTHIGGTLIAGGDEQLLLDASAAVALTDHYIIGSTEYTVAGLEVLAPAGTAVLNTLLLRLA